MKKTITATVWKESEWFIAQCLEVAVVSQGETEQDSLHNLADALKRSFLF